MINYLLKIISKIDIKRFENCISFTHKSCAQLSSVFISFLSVNVFYAEKRNYITYPFNILL